MFHAGGYQGSRGRSTAFSGKSYSGIFKADWKGPLRCGIHFCTLSCIFLVVGVVLTCVGIHDVFGETVPITGPILLTVGTLFSVLACRQFFLAHSRKKLKQSLKDKESQDGKKTVVVDADDGTGPSTILMENTDGHDMREKSGPHEGDEHQLNPYSRKSCNIEDDSHDLKYTNSLDTNTYMWPAIPMQPSPLTCISMMLGKDPASIFGPPQAISFPCAYSPATTSTSLSPSRIESMTTPTSLALDSSHLHQTHSPTTSSDPTLQLHSPSQPITPGTVAVVSAEEPNADKPAHPEHANSKVKMSYEGLPAMIAREGINNFPNRTAIMMLRTLELQETI